MIGSVAAKAPVGQTIVLCGLPGCGAAVGSHSKAETAGQLPIPANKRRSTRGEVPTAVSRFKLVAVLSVAILLSPLTIGYSFAQEPEGGGMAPGGRAGRTGARGGRGGAGTREFLGLGPAPDPAEAKKGEPLYKQNCATCHGENARGSQGPNLVRSVVVLHDEKDEEIGPVIKAGRPQGGMPAFPQLSPAEIHSISQYLKMQVELAANRGTYGQTYGDLRNKVTGDPSQGEAFFKANCTSCHSTTGDLAKIGAKFQQAAQLQQRFLWPASFWTRESHRDHGIGREGERNHQQG